MPILRLDLVFDTVCPWCFIGKRRFARALQLRPYARVDIRWRPFMLNPDIPAGGLDRALYLERKFGSTYRVQRIQGAVILAGREENIPFNFDAIAKMPNSFDSHRLVQWAAGDERQSDLVERIFCAYFIEGRDIGNRDVLAELAREVGLSESLAREFLAGGSGIAAIEADHMRVRRWGISGVPCFVFDESYAVAGAQDADMLVRLMDIVRETELETVSPA